MRYTEKTGSKVTHESALTRIVFIYDSAVVVSSGCVEAIPA